MLNLIFLKKDSNAQLFHSSNFPSRFLKLTPKQHSLEGVINLQKVCPLSNFFGNSLKSAIAVCALLTVITFGI